MRRPGIQVTQTRFVKYSGSRFGKAQLTPVPADVKSSVIEIVQHSAAGVSDEQGDWLWSNCRFIWQQRVSVVLTFQTSSKVDTPCCIHHIEYPIYVVATESDKHLLALNLWQYTSFSQTRLIG
jgi:hypothetical protein